MLYPAYREFYPGFPALPCLSCEGPRGLCFKRHHIIAGRRQPRYWVAARRSCTRLGCVSSMGC